MRHEVGARVESDRGRTLCFRSALPMYSPETPDRSHWNESAARRTSRDTYDRLKTPSFWVAATTLGVVGAVLAVIAKSNGVVIALGTLAGRAGTLLLTSIVLALMTPDRQRDEARAARDHMDRFLRPVARLSYDEVRTSLSACLADGQTLLDRLTGDLSQRQLHEFYDDASRWISTVEVVLQPYLRQWYEGFARTPQPQRPETLPSMNEEVFRDWLAGKIDTLTRMVEDRYDAEL